jgi:hypothetical protein
LLLSNILHAENNYGDNSFCTHKQHQKGSIAGSKNSQLDEKIKTKNIGCEEMQNALTMLIMMD